MVSADSLHPYQLPEEHYDSGRWIIRFKVKGEWEKLSGTNSYSNRANAVAGISRYRTQNEINRTRHLAVQVMAKPWSEVRIS